MTGVMAAAPGWAAGATGSSLPSTTADSTEVPSRVTTQELQVVDVEPPPAAARSWREALASNWVGRRYMGSLP